MNQSSNQPNQTDGQKAQVKSVSQETVNLLKIAEFIELRQQQKNNLINSQVKKNSLSKNKQLNTIKTKEIIEKPTSNQALYKLLTLLAEQLNEGHTIYYLAKSNSRQHELFTIWQNQGWLSVIDSHSNLIKINTPIVMQFLQNNLSKQAMEQPTNSEQPCIFWLHRQWRAEYQLAEKLLKIAQRPVVQLISHSTTTDNVTDDKSKQPNAQQQVAIEKASQFALSIITGGPGTGKTFTVAKLVTKLQHDHEINRKQDPNLPPLSIALTAPTGKAAQRMQASLAQSLGEQNSALDNAKTLHRLLGIGQDGSPRYHAGNPLPDDLVIVDEASMLGLELASQLVNAIKPMGRLIILGDANQLSAVDAGSVLADLCEVPALQPFRTQLIESVRFNDQSNIGQLALALQLAATTRAQKAQKLQHIHRLVKQLPVSDSLDTTLKNSDKIPFFGINEATNYRELYKILAQPYHEFFELMRQWHLQSPALEDEQVRVQLFKTFDSYRVLTAGHQGQLGAQVINQMLASEFFYQTNLVRTKEIFYHGAPIMITRNDYQLGLFNGDIGICLIYQNSLIACFPDKIVPTNRLSRENCERAYAMTIHKSQGSEFNKVAICLDRQHARLLSQELVYTAVTRSRQNVTIVSNPAVFDRAILQKGNRQTGLQLQFEHLANQ